MSPRHLTKCCRHAVSTLPLPMNRRHPQSPTNGCYPIVSSRRRPTTPHCWRTSSAQSNRYHTTTTPMLPRQIQIGNTQLPNETALPHRRHTASLNESTPLHRPQQTTVAPSFQLSTNRCHHHRPTVLRCCQPCHRAVALVLPSFPSHQRLDAAHYRCYPATWLPQRTAPSSHPPQYNTGVEDDSTYKRCCNRWCGRVKWGGSGADDAAIGDDCQITYSSANNINCNVLL